LKVSVEVNLDGLEAKLQELGPKVAKRTLRKSLKAVGTMWVSAAKAKVPKDTGALADSIDMKMRTKPSEESGSVTVSPMYGGKGSQDPGVYAMFVEFPMKNRPKYHTQPFLRPTFDATAEAAIALFAETTKTNLEGM
jgi:HK97 gp10 family phage protein